MRLKERIIGNENDGSLTSGAKSNHGFLRSFLRRDAIANADCGFRWDAIWSAQQRQNRRQATHEQMFFEYPFAVGVNIETLRGSLDVQIRAIAHRPVE